MKSAFIVVLLSLIAAFSASAAEIQMVPQPQPYIWINTYGDSGSLSMDEYTPWQWHRVDISDLVPDGTIAVFVSGILMITHGDGADTFPQGLCCPGKTADLHLYFGNGNGTVFPGAHGQTCAAVADGRRSNFSTWVPVVNGRIEFMWTRTTEEPWPENAAYGWNIAIQMAVIE